MFGRTEQDIASIIQVLRLHPEVKEALIFGSRAMGNYKPGSDIDIVLKGRVSEALVMTVNVELNERTPLPYRFDLVAYDLLSDSPLKEHIDHHARSFYVNGFVE
jgi:predicted nucleotidyltransferase